MLYSHCLLTSSVTHRNAPQIQHEITEQALCVALPAFCEGRVFSPQTASFQEVFIAVWSLLTMR